MHESIPVNVILSKSIRSIEILAIDILVNSNIKIRIVTLYIPPNRSNNTEDINITCDLIAEIIPSKDTPLILCGDFNAKNITSDFILSPLYNMLQRLKLSQIVDFPTRDSHLIDFIYVSDKNIVSNVEKAPPISDHESITFELQSIPFI